MSTIAFEELYQQHSRRVLATLIRLLRDFDLAEEVMQEAFAAALQVWPEQGVPDNPRAWLVRTGHNKGIDQIRRRQTAREFASWQLQEEHSTPDCEPGVFNDDMLRLIFTCCHPGLALEVQLPLTLREVCGLTTEQVAAGLLQKPTSVAQRIVRAKRKIRDAAIPYEIPGSRNLQPRLQAVLHVIYLIFNEGYSRSDGVQVVDVSLTREAIRLAGLLSTLLPDPEVYGVLALLLLQDARRDARQDTEGNLVTLEDQDRRLWDQDQIALGQQWLIRSLHQGSAGPYTLQAAIAAVHSEAVTAEVTDWAQLVGLYDRLFLLQSTPVVALNRAVAMAMRDGPEQGLARLDELADQPVLQTYHLYHAARADLFRRCQRPAEACEAYEQALKLVRQEPERQFLVRRLQSLQSPTGKYALPSP
ncbi:RNA polymerase sigma factor [uncultured Marinobacter sp.]|uniref:RNA polymerase sigma factor n=1 Tax=uncultured Marinobacter sp. TaxID=187379 RepID=UPI0030DB94EF